MYGTHGIQLRESSSFRQKMQQQPAADAGRNFRSAPPTSLELLASWRCLKFWIPSTEPIPTYVLLFPVLLDQSATRQGDRPRAVHMLIVPCFFKITDS
jgi:hypothetical protein